MVPIQNYPDNPLGNLRFNIRFFLGAIFTLSNWKGYK